MKLLRVGELANCGFAEADAEGGVTGDRGGCCGADGVATGEATTGEWGHSWVQLAELMKRAKEFRAECSREDQEGRSQWEAGWIGDFVQVGGAGEDALGFFAPALVVADVREFGFGGGEFAKR